MQDRPGIGDSLAALLVPVHGLHAWPGNARTSDVAQLADSLRVNGQYRPLVYQASTGRVLSGNHTLEAVRSLGWRQVAAVGIDVDDDRAARIVLVDNRTADLGSSDQQLVLQLVEEVGLAGTGIDARRLAALLRLRDAPDWATYGEDAADGLERLTCPSCGLVFPA